MVRSFGSLLLTALVRVGSSRERRWFKRVKEQLGSRIFEQNVGHRIGLALDPSGKGWVIRYCAHRGDSHALGLLLIVLHSQRSASNPDIEWIGALQRAVIDVARRLMAFHPYYQIRHQLWDYLVAHFLSDWDGLDPNLRLSDLDLDFEVDKIVKVIMRLAERGFVGNEFQEQSRLAFWFTRGPEAVILAEIDDLEQNPGRQIQSDSCLYQLLKHARYWRTRNNQSLEPRYERKPNQSACISNALDALNKPYKDDLLVMRELPTKDDREHYYRIRELDRERRENPPPPEPPRPKRRSALADFLQVCEDRKNDPPFRDKRPDESHIAYAMAIMLGDPEPTKAKPTETSNRNPSVRIPKHRQVGAKSGKAPASRGPPGVQHERGVQRQ